MKIRTYHCDDCKVYFKTISDTPECPRCHGAGIPPAPPKRSSLPAPAIQSSETKIKNEVSKQLMDDFGMTNMKDNQRPGDIAAIPDVAAQKRVQEQAKGFWNPATYSAGLAQVGGNSGIPKGHAMDKMQRLAKKIESTMR